MRQDSKEAVVVIQELADKAKDRVLRNEITTRMNLEKGRQETNDGWAGKRPEPFVGRITQFMRNVLCSSFIFLFKHLVWNSASLKGQVQPSERSTLGFCSRNLNLINEGRFVRSVKQSKCKGTGKGLGWIFEGMAAFRIKSNGLWREGRSRKVPGTQRAKNSTLFLGNALERVGFAKRLLISNTMEL